MTGPSVPAVTDVRLDHTPVGPTAVVRTRDGRWIRLHSGRDPVGEAERLAASLCANAPPQALILIGVGLGYLLDALGRRSPEARIVALEPLRAVAEAFLERPTSHAWLASGRLTLLVGPDYDGADEAWRSLSAAPDAPMIVAPVIEREFPGEADRAQEVVRQLRFSARANEGARRRFAPRYLLNTIRNIATIAESADVRALFGAFADCPAVVVAAGPSLDRNIEALRRAHGRTLTIAVDTALRPLLEAGIEPQLVVALDPSELNARHLRYLPDTGRTWLVAEGSLDPSAFERFAGRTFVFEVAGHEPWPWLRSIGLDRGRLRAWGSVLTSAFDLALQAGCNPIAFAGADLAYTGGQPYCRGTVYEHEWARRVALGEPLEAVWAQTTAAKARVLADDIHGRPVPTSAALLAFRDWIVKESTAHPSRRFVNGTGGGVLLGGRIEQGALTELLALTAGRPVQGHAAVAAVSRTWRSRRGPERPSIRQAVDELAGAAADRDPIATWLQFAAPDLSAEAVGRALDDACRGLAGSVHGATAPAGPVLPAGGAPERAMAVWAAITGNSAVGHAATPSAGHASATDPAVEWQTAGCLLAALLRSPGPLLTVGAGHPLVPGAHVPASRALDWSPDAVVTVHAFESALAKAASGPPTPLRQPDALQVRIVAADAARTLGLPRVSGWTCAELAARLRLLADWLSVTAAVAGEPIGFIAVREGRDLPLRVAATLVRAYAGAVEVAAVEGPAGAPCPDGRATALAVVAVGDGAHTVPCAPDPVRTADALTGALTQPSADSGGRADDPSSLPALALTVPDGVATAGIHIALRPGGPTPSARPPALPHARPLGWALPIRLNAPSPGCMIGNGLDDGHALFTVVNGRHSIRVDAGGTWTVEPGWPGPIVGEVRWGATGAVAWHNGETSRVLWRDRPDGRVHAGTIPFTACLAFPQVDGSIWWTSFEGGLWSWMPGQHWEQLVDSPPVMGLLTTREGVVLQPSGEDLTFTTRPALTDAFLWTPGAAAVQPVPLGAEGPCWSMSSGPGWAARAYPYGDSIQLSHRGGVRYGLTCGSPFNLAWAGASLIVSTARGDVLLFRDLLSHLAT